MTDKCKAELIRILKEKHGVFMEYIIKPTGIISHEDSLGIHDFDHAVVTDAVHAWLLGLQKLDIDAGRDGYYAYIKPKSERFFSRYPLSVAIWNVTEFVLKEMGDAI